MTSDVVLSCCCCCLSAGAEEKVPQRICATEILPNFRVSFLVRFASQPLFHWAVPSNYSDRENLNGHRYMATGSFPIVFAPFFACFRPFSHFFPRFFALFELSVLTVFRKAFQPEFGAYRGSARVLNSPSNPQNCRKKEKIPEKGTFKTCAKLWYAPNPGSKEI